MEANEPIVYIKGMLPVIEKDLKLHQDILSRTLLELGAFRAARSHEIKKKKHYKSLIGGEKWDDDALRESMKQIAQNINHIGKKIKLTEDKIAHEKMIVDEMARQKKDYETLTATAERIKGNGSAN